MGNSAAATLFSIKVNFSRETSSDFYLSGDQVHGTIQIVTNDNNDDFNFKYGSLYAELIGELHDTKTNSHHDDGSTHNIEICFKKRAHVTKLSSDNRELATSRLQSYTWAFDGQLDLWLPSSLPSDDISDPYICYYVCVYLHRAHLARKFPFTVFTRAPMPIGMRQSLPYSVIEASARYKDMKLHGILPNNGLAVPGQNFMLHLEIDNPMRVKVESIRATLIQYRNITDEKTDYIIFSATLPGFKPKGFDGEYRQSTYELSLPLDKCQVMAPTSSYKHVRYELHVKCHIRGLVNNYFTLILPIICTTDHQRPSQIMNGLISLPEIIMHLPDNNEGKPPPSYDDFIASEILPKYEDIIH